MDEDEKKPLTKAEIVNLLDHFSDDTVIWAEMDNIANPITAVIAHSWPDGKRRAILRSEFLGKAQRDIPDATTRGQ